MRIKDTAGRRFDPSLIGVVPTGRLLWVDQVHGNDDLAARERLTIPFKTLGAAKAAANPATNEYDLIIVLPGTYNERNLLKSRVNWHFLPGARVVYTYDTTEGAIFDTSSYGTNGAVNCAVTGYGEFAVSNSKTTGHLINSTANDSVLLIEARKLTASAASAVKVVSGFLEVRISEQITSGSGHAVEVVGGSAQNLIRAHTLYTSGGSGLIVSGGSVELHAHRVQSTADAAVKLSGGTGLVTVRAAEVLSDSAAAVIYETTSNPTLLLVGARIISTLASSSGRAIYISQGGSNKIKLAGCTLLASSSADAAIRASTADTVVQLHSETVANKGQINILFEGAEWTPNKPID